MNISLDGDTYYETWIGIVRDALSSLDQEKYNWIHLPHSGGYYEQDDFFLMVWGYVRYSYIEARNDVKFMEALRNRYKK